MFKLQQFFLCKYDLFFLVRDSYKKANSLKLQTISIWWLYIVNQDALVNHDLLLINLILPQV